MRSLPLKQKDRTQDENYTPQTTEINPRNLCETLELVSKKLHPNTYCIFPYNTTLHSNSRKIFQPF